MALESACFNYSEVWLTTVQPHSFVHSINLSIISHDPSRTQIMVKTDKLKRSHFLSLMKRLLQGRVQGPGTRRREVLPSLGCQGLWLQPRDSASSRLTLSVALTGWFQCQPGLSRETEPIGDIQTCMSLTMGIGSCGFGGWEVPLPAVYWLQNWESQWGKRIRDHWCKSWNPVAWEPRSLISEDRKRWTYQLKKR